jgi:hypothetical protein
MGGGYFQNVGLELTTNLYEAPYFGNFPISLKLYPSLCDFFCKHVYV